MLPLPRASILNANAKAKENDKKRDCHIFSIDDALPSVEHNLVTQWAERA
jgi:hypothetical protein